MFVSRILKILASGEGKVVLVQGASSLPIHLQFIFLTDDWLNVFQLLATLACFVLTSLLWDRSGCLSACKPFCLCALDEFFSCLAQAGM